MDEDRRRRLRSLEEKITDPRSVTNVDCLLVRFKPLSHLSVYISLVKFQCRDRFGSQDSVCIHEVHGVVAIDLCYMWLQPVFRTLSKPLCLTATTLQSRGRKMLRPSATDVSVQSSMCSLVFPSAM